MKTLTGSYLKFFPHKNGEKERLIWCPREVAVRRKEIGFLRFSFSVSFQRKTIESISAVTSALSSEKEMLVESEQIEMKNTDPLKTVRVRFKLQKECSFGQQFFVVGDDPILGLWDPFDGVPFVWSDGHVWTAELDVPCGKVIKYKFILKEDSKTISWQPGPDRILGTWDTEKTITVFEDWDNPQSQNIIEEEGLISGASEETLMNSELLIVAENVTKPMQDEGSDVHKQLASNNGHASLAEGNIEDKRKRDLMTRVHYTKQEGVLGNDDREVNGSDLFSSKDGERLVSEQEVPVLVPGMIPMLTEETKEPMQTEGTGEPVLDEVEKRNVSDSSIGSDEAESKDNRISASLLDPTETSEMPNVEKQESYGKEQQEIWEGDMNWGQRTFKKFLANLGF